VLRLFHEAFREPPIVLAYPFPLPKPRCLRPAEIIMLDERLNKMQSFYATFDEHLVKDNEYLLRNAKKIRCQAYLLKLTTILEVHATNLAELHSDATKRLVTDSSLNTEILDSYIELVKDAQCSRRSDEIKAILKKIASLSELYNSEQKLGPETPSKLLRRRAAERRTNMKFIQMLDVNMVPEWRHQYIDYRDLDSMLRRGIEKATAKGDGSYSDLIQYNQNFGERFMRVCQQQLQKINHFHQEKLSEMSGKYKNLQMQLENILSSAYNKDSSKMSSFDTSKSLLIKELASTARLSQLTSGNSTRSSMSEESSSRSSPSSNGNLLQTNNAGKNSAGMPLTTRTVFGNQPGPGQKLAEMARRLSCYVTRETRLSSFAGLTSSKSNNNSNGNNPQQQARIPTINIISDSHKKMIASYRKKISHLKFAYRELYFSLVLLEQYTQLNYTGFEQLLRKHDRMFASTMGRQFFEEHVQTSEFYSNLQTIDGLIEGVEHVYTLHFENGDRRRAIERLQVPTNIYRPFTSSLDFRVGLEIGALAVLFITVLVTGFCIENEYDWRIVFRLYRSPLLLVIFLFQSGISIVIWKNYKINHVLIFELDPRNNLSYHHFFEFGALLGIIWCLSVLMFLFSDKLGVPPLICPLIVVFIITFYLFNPTATCHHQARFWLLRILGRIFTAPFHRVKFADFWIADQLVSIVPLFLDLEYLSCFYTTGELHVSNLNMENADRCVIRRPHDLVIRTIFAALPAWFRCAQCLRRWRDENWNLHHLCNAGKYGCMVAVVCLSTIAQYNNPNLNHLDSWTLIWIVAAVFTSSLTAYWDIIYDYGLFNSFDRNRSMSCASSLESVNSGSLDIVESQKKKKKRYPFLRDELVYPVWIYYFAIVEDFVLRFGWIFTISLKEFSGIELGLVVSLLAPVEMFRRFVWNNIRLENEQLNNCGMFREVRDIPIEVLAPIDESHLDKVIMMMDSNDGPSIRHRLVRRRVGVAVAHGRRWNKVS
ncbi:Xenotropic and polytropic retrovirus receptor 1, partial [Fragariocoptes setiger]